MRRIALPVLAVSVLANAVLVGVVLTSGGDRSPARPGTALTAHAPKPGSAQMPILEADAARKAGVPVWLGAIWDDQPAATARMTDDPDGKLGSSPVPAQTPPVYYLGPAGKVRVSITAIGFAAPREAGRISTPVGPAWIVADEATGKQAVVQVGQRRVMVAAAPDVDFERLLAALRRP